MQRALLLGLLWSASLDAAPYKPPVEPEPKASPKAWLAKREGAAVWCAFLSRKAVEAALDSGDYDTDEGVTIWHDGKRIQAIMVSSESEDAFADDIYYLDARQRITRMVRTGHYINDPVFSVAFVPDWTGRLALTSASREVVRLMEQAQYEPYITDWPKYASFGSMPFRSLIGLRPNVSIRRGCAPAAP